MIVCKLTNRNNSGRVVSTTYDAANRPAYLQGAFTNPTTNTTTVTNYIGNPTTTPAAPIQYWPHGAIYAYPRGNNLEHAESYNGRLQLTESYESTGNGNTPAHLLFVSCPNWGLNPSNLNLYDICPHYSRHDFLPFGEEVPALASTGRTGPGWGVADDVNQRFTGKERDAESQLDYFGARYYGSALGRFTSPDWSAKPVPVPYADFSNPQTLNEYAYVLNNPLGNRDADGHICVFGFGNTCPLPPPPSAPDPPGAPHFTGVNPVTGTDGFARNPKGEPGHERPGVGGAGYYGAPRRGYAHQGEDISGVSGSSTIHASTSGTVTFSGNKSGYGNTIIIDNGKGVSTLYGHNSENDVRVGSSVQQGERIGVLGQTGNAAGQPPSEAHVHFEVKVDGSRVNPGVWLNSDVDQTFVPAPPPH